MKDPALDPILRQVHMVKDGISSEFNYSVKDLCSYLRKTEKQELPINKVSLSLGKNKQRVSKHSKQARPKYQAPA
jgi:hypothetical protein